MRQRQGMFYYLICDTCGHEDDESFSEFFEAVNHKKQSDWISRCTDGEWEDICPECQEME